MKLKNKIQSVTDWYEYTKKLFKNIDCLFNTEHDFGFEIKTNKRFKMVIIGENGYHNSSKTLFVIIIF